MKNASDSPAGSWRMRTRLGPSLRWRCLLPGGTVIVSPGPRWCATPFRSSRSAPSITSKCSVWRSWTCGCATTPRALPTASNSK